MGNSNPCKIVTPKNFKLKLCTRDYAGETTNHVNFGFNRYSGGFSPNCDFFDCLYRFVSGTRPGRTAEPIFTLYGSNDVFPRRKVLFRGYDDG